MYASYLLSLSNILIVSCLVNYTTSSKYKKFMILTELLQQLGMQENATCG